MSTHVPGWKICSKGSLREAENPLHGGKEMEMETKPLEAIPRTKELISIEEFLAFSDTDRSEFKTIRIVPPKIGQKGFGKMLVVRKNPIYEFQIE